MGVMRFLIHPADVLRDWPEAHRAYLSGTDHSVWPTRVELDGQILGCRRQNSDSSKLNLVWPVAGFGKPLVTTASLPEREAPYLLPVELARGKIVQIRNQLAVWQEAGLSIPASFQEVHRAAQHCFARAASCQDSPEAAAGEAQESLRYAFHASELLMTAYTRQRIEQRQRQYPRLPTALGCSLGDRASFGDWGEPFLEAFNSAGIPLEWRVIEPVEGDYHWEVYDAQLAWCEKHHLVPRGGPFLDLGAEGLPKWLYQWEQDYWNLQSFVCDFVETSISRYLGRIRNWEVVARANTGGGIALSEEQRLRLAAKAIEVARHADPESQLFVRVDQPWGEYQARGQHKLSPLQFADALVRADLGLNGINLEIAFGYTPGGSTTRDLLDISRLIDLWSSLSVPLQVTLAAPAGRGSDLQQTTDLEVDCNTSRIPWSEELQAAWADAIVQLLMSKPQVTSIFWTHFSDRDPHRFPHAGLVRPHNQPRPALERLVRLHEQYW
jgi:hypothetical protein